MEKKYAQFDEMEFKLDAAKGTFEGYASVFGGVDSYKDTVMPGAYKDTIKQKERAISMYFNHVKYRADMPARIGKWTNLEEDSKGLLVAGRLTPGHPTAEAVKAAMADGTLTGLSIGYRIPEGGSVKRGGIRELHKIDLFEISAVDDPADAAAQIDRASIKSMLDDLRTKSDIESFLRDVAGFSKSAAVAFIGQFQTVLLRDADEDGAKNEQLLGILQKFNTESKPFITLGVPNHDNRKQN